MLELLIYILFFIFLSGVFAMIDAAILSISSAEIETMVRKKKRGASFLKKIRHHMTRAVVVIVLFTNTINILGPILVGQKAIELYDNTILGIITAILTFGTIVFSEIIPKSLGVHYSPFISRLTAPVILFFTYVFFPLVILLELIAKLFEKGNRRIGTEEQIRSLVELGWRSGYIEKDESQLIKKVFRLNDRNAKDIMTPLNKVAGIRSNLKIQDAVKLLLRKEYSRYPVFGRSEDDVKGYIITGDLMDVLVEGRQDLMVNSLVRKVLFVDMDYRSDDLLLLFRTERIHMAIVKDNKKTVGIVTLEDVLEELVGEIEDENDV